MVEFLLTLLGIWIFSAVTGLTIYGFKKINDLPKDEMLMSIAMVFWPFSFVGICFYGLWLFGKTVINTMFGKKEIKTDEQ